MKDLKTKIIAVITSLLTVILAYYGIIVMPEQGENQPTNPTQPTTSTVTYTSIDEMESVPVMLDDQVSIPAWLGEPYVIINDDQPTFSKDEMTCTAAFELFSELDEAGRCGVAFANVCPELMPTEKRGDISRVHPTGWQKGMGWERCHLIGFQLTGENANEKNLVTGSHYMNVTAMLPFENRIADYVKDTGNHVLYRVTPVYDGDDLVVSGAQMEAYSVEDKGEGVCFNIYVFNIVPGSDIDYDTGIVTTSSGSDSQGATVETVIPELDEPEDVVYISKSGKIHLKSNCSGMSNPTEMTQKEAEKKGYVPCPKCNP